MPSRTIALEAKKKKKKDNVEEDSAYGNAKTMPSYTHLFPPSLPYQTFSHWQLVFNASRLHLNFWQPPQRGSQWRYQIRTNLS